jgi:hypothetical protein
MDTPPTNNEPANPNEMMDLDKLLDTQQFSSRPRIYFSPFENIGKSPGPHRFAIQLMKEDAKKITKMSKQGKDNPIVELVVRVVDDSRDGDGNQTHPTKCYLFDAGEEIMAVIQQGKKSGINIFATPLAIAARRKRTGTKNIWMLDCEFKVKTEKGKPSTTAGKGTSPDKKVDDDEFNFDDDK